MKNTSASESTCIRPRALLGFLPYSIGVFLALLVFVAFPSSSALAAPKCKIVEFSTYGYGGYINVSMTTATPSPYIIFYTTNGAAPTHNGPTPTGSTHIFTSYVEVDYGTEVYFRALAYKASPYIDSDITDLDVCNYCP